MDDEVEAMIEAAYAADRAGREHEAVAHYERAWKTGRVPPDAEPDFLVGFGSTLRNVGRIDEAVRVLGAAVAAHPDDLALRAFLALAQHSAGAHALALRSALDVVLALASGSPSLTRYARALGGYRDAL